MEQSAAPQRITLDCWVVKDLAPGPALMERGQREREKQRERERERERDQERDHVRETQREIEKETF